MIVASCISPKAAKGRRSAIEGRGLVAVSPIGAGEIVAIKGGHIVNTATLRSLPDRLQAPKRRSLMDFTWWPWRTPSTSR